MAAALVWPAPCCDHCWLPGLAAKVTATAWPRRSCHHADPPASPPVSHATSHRQHCVPMPQLHASARAEQALQAGQGVEALTTYDMMRESGLQLPRYALPGLLKACGKSSDLEEGKRFHAEALRNGWQSDLFVGTALIAMYAKFGSVWEAKQVFDGLARRDVVSWNAMLAAYASDRQPDEVLWMYEEMMEEGVSPDRQTFITVLQACSVLAEKEKDVNSVAGGWIKPKATVRGRALQFQAQVKGCASDALVGGTLVSVYSKGGSMLDAQLAFDDLSERHVDTWNALLLAYVRQGQAEKALLFYEEMMKEGKDPDDRTFVSALNACILLVKEEEDSGDGWSTKAKSLNAGKIVHAQAWQKGYSSNAFVSSTLHMLRMAEGRRLCSCTVNYGRMV